MSQELKKEPSTPVNAPAPYNAPVKAPAKGLKKGPGPKKGFKAAGPKVAAPAPTNTAIDNSPKNFAELKKQFKNPGQAAAPPRPLPKRDLGIGEGLLQAKKAQIQLEEAARANDFAAGQLQKKSAFQSELAHVSVKSLRDQINEAFTKRAQMSETEFKASKRQNLEIFKQQMVALQLVEHSVSDVSAVAQVAVAAEQPIPEAVLDQIYDLELRLNPSRAEQTSVSAAVDHQRVIELAARDLIQRIGTEGAIPSLHDYETWTEYTLLATTLEWLVVRLHSEEANQLVQSNLTEESVRMVVNMAKDCKHVNQVVKAVKDSKKINLESSPVAVVSLPSLPVAVVSLPSLSSSSEAAKPLLVRQDSREFARRQREESAAAIAASSLLNAPAEELVPMPPHPTHGSSSSLFKSTRITISSEAASASSSSSLMSSITESADKYLSSSLPSLFARPAPEVVRVVEFVERHDFSKYTIEALLNFVLFNYKHDNTRLEAEKAFDQLQKRFTEYKREDKFLEALKLMRYESPLSLRRVWLETICPEVKYFSNLLAATRDIFNNKWHNQGSGLVMYKTPDTINKARAIICTSSYMPLFDGLKKNESLPEAFCSQMEFSSKFSCATASYLMQELSTLVHKKYDSKYDALRVLLPSLPGKEPKDLDECVRKVDAILKPAPVYAYNW